MDIHEEPSAEFANFGLEAVDHSSHIEIKFSHSEGPAFECSLHIGFLDEGIARSGDGKDLGDISRDVRVVLFDEKRIDTTSVTADYAIAANRERPTAVFLRWRYSSASEAYRAIGSVVTFDSEKGFDIGNAKSATEATNFLRDVEMLLEDQMTTEAEAPKITPEQEQELELEQEQEQEQEHNNFFTELSVDGYRGFASERTLRLAAPNGKSGSGITVLVGANNSGKSTFLEAIHMIARSRQQTELSFPQPRRHREKDSVAISLTHIDGREVRVETTNAGSSQATATWSPVGGPPGKFDIQVTPSRRQFSPYFGNMGIAGRNWSLSDQEFSRTQLRENFVGRLKKVDREPESRRVFDALLQEIIGEDFNWTIDEIGTGQQFLKLIESDGAWHTSEGLGDGLVSLLFIVDALYDSEPGSLIAIDEPELSLHPQLVRRLAKVLSRFAKDRQIVVATHSPLLVDWSDVANGATVARIFKRDGRSEIAQASEQILSKVAKLADSRNVKNPHTVGVVAREAFFLEDGVILTEGQDDAAYLPRILDDLGLPRTDNIYGWGSGGVGNIPSLAQLFKELGFTKIGAILDDDHQDGTAAALEKLLAMAPEVLVRQIPAPDIRYKPEMQTQNEVLGLLDNANEHVRAELRVGATSALKAVMDHVAAPKLDANA